MVAMIGAMQGGAPGLDRFEDVCVPFPGTTTNQSAVLAFKRGAFVAGQTVQPVACRITAGSGLDTAWVNDGPGQLSLFLRLMAEPVNKVRLGVARGQCGLFLDRS